MPGCIVSATTASFCSVVNRRRRATPVMTSTRENVSDIGIVPGLCLGPPARAGVRSKRGAVQDSLFKQEVKDENSRFCGSPRAFIERVSKSLKYATIASLWRDIPGVASVHVTPYLEDRAEDTFSCILGC